MNELIRLEHKKLKLGRYMFGLVMANVFALMITAKAVLDHSDITGFDVHLALSIFDQIYGLVMIIAAGVLCHKVFKKEFDEGTMLLMLRYPIRRRDIILSKTLYILLHITIVGSLSYMLTLITLFTIARYSFFMEVPIEIRHLSLIFIMVVPMMLELACVSFISLYFTLLKPISVSPITPVIFLGLIYPSLYENIFPYTLNPILLGLSGLGLATIYLLIKNQETIYTKMTKW